MTYAELPVEVQDKLVSTKFALVRFSDGEEEKGKVLDVLLLAQGSHMDVERLGGYVVAASSAWFAFVSEGKADDEALRMAKEAAEIWE